MRLLVLASLVAGEAQGCPAEAQRAVVHVALNRLAALRVGNDATRKDDGGRERVD